MEEHWKDIQGYEGLYMVSDMGRIYSIKRNKIKQYKVEKKHARICLCKDGKQTMKRIHRLVAQVFVPNPENKPEVHHIDENPLNNHADNLMWVTHEEHEKIHASQDHHVYRYSLDGLFLNEYTSMTDAITQTGYDRITIINCCTGKYKTAHGYQWSYERYNRIPPVKSRGKRISEGNSKAIEMFTLDNVFVAEFQSLKSASEKTGILASSISNNCRGESKTAGGHIFRYKQPEVV